MRTSESSENRAGPPSGSRSYLYALLLILAGAACYSNTLHVPMILDDEGSIQLHTPVHGLANYFSEGWPGYNYLPNRAFGYLTFALNYEFGEFSLPGYHLVNLAIHIVAGLLVYSLVRLMFRTPQITCAGLSPARRDIFAAAVALLFICHPVQTQAVTYIVQRFTSMTSMLYLAAVVCYLKWRMPADSSRQPVAWYLLALLSTLLAMKTKEISVTLPVMFILTETVFFGMPGRKQLVRMSPLLLTFLLIPLTTYFKVAPLIETAGGSGSFLSDVHTPAYNMIKMTRWEYLCTQFSVIVTYLRLLFLPVNQHLDYDYPITRNFLEPRPILSLLLLLSILGFAVYMLIKSRINRDDKQSTDAPLMRIAAFGIFWFFITLSIESSIVVLQDVIYEHRLYLPSVGFLLTLSSLGMMGLNRLETRFSGAAKAFTVILVCIAVPLSAATYFRNSVWQDWITLWSDNVAKAPDKARPRNILGIGYYYRGDFSRALLQYREAVRLKPDYAEVYYNLGLVHAARKEHEQAIAMYMKMLGISAFNAPLYAKVYNEIGINYAEYGNPEQALKAFATAIEHEPEIADYRINYAFALSTAGFVSEAVQQYQKALELDPGNAFALKALQELKSGKTPDGA